MASLESCYPDILRRFEGELLRWDHDSATAMGISGDSRFFLESIGLPNLERWTVKFRMEPHRIISSTDDGKKLKFVAIGDDFKYPIVLDEGSGGRVLELNPSIPGGFRFINSNVQLFGVFIYLHQQSIDQSQSAVPDRFPAITALLEEQMRRLDVNALASRDNFWSTFIEEMKLY